MDNQHSGSAWFALSIKHQHERAVAAELAATNVEALLPLYRSLRRWSDRTKELDAPLFPGYVFARFATGARVQVLRIPGVARIVGFGGIPSPVSEIEISSLRTAMDSKLPLSPWPYLKAGDRVRVEKGPLKGIEGTLLEEKDVFRLVIGVEMLQRSVAVELSPDMIVPLRAGVAGA